MLSPLGLRQRQCLSHVPSLAELLFSFPHSVAHPLIGANSGTSALFAPCRPDIRNWYILTVPSVSWSKLVILLQCCAHGLDVENTWELHWYAGPSAVLITLVCHCGFYCSLGYQSVTMADCAGCSLAVFSTKCAQGGRNVNSATQVLFWTGIVVMCVVVWHHIVSGFYVEWPPPSASHKTAQPHH